MARSQTPATALVTGDIVLDCHLYGGVKTTATSFSEPGTRYISRLGGAALTRKLLNAAAMAQARAWDDKRAELSDHQDWPKNFARERPTHVVNLGFAVQEDHLPRRLHSYGVWKDKPQTRGSSKRVWRVATHFGYGPTDDADPFAALTPAAMDRPHLTVIDDGGIFYRGNAAKRLWPDLCADGHVLLKMSSPLCRGDLWEEILAAGDEVLERLIVVVSAADLRREDAQISRRLSWERCAETTRDALMNDPLGEQLRKAAHVIVTFESEGALWLRMEKAAPRIRLYFDPARLEGDHAREVEDSVYGFQTCFTVGIAHHVLKRHASGLSDRSPFDDPNELDRAIARGITAGLMAKRQLLELGHGPVESDEPGFPLDDLAATIDEPPSGLVCADVPRTSSASCPWTILAGSDTVDPLIGLGQLTARYGTSALSHVPALRMGDLVTVDRGEIEGYRTLAALISDYEAIPVQKKPLSIGVFGPPGAGKGFGVKAIAQDVLARKLPPGDKIPFLEFNLSQFKSPDELIGALHQVRDAVLAGTTPVAFWDEFDSKSYDWLQYLLAPMQDGRFQEGQISHPIGKCIFIFAGGTSPTLEEFGVADPSNPTKLSPKQQIEYWRSIREYAERFRAYQLRKGPDFVSRLHGFLNVRGPNPDADGACTDVTWPVRRALMLRGVLKAKSDEELNIDPGLLYALLGAKRYQHGSRSFEKILLTLNQGRAEGRVHRAALPADPILARDTDTDDFNSILHSRDPFKHAPDLERLALAVHAQFLEAADRSQYEAAAKGFPDGAWVLHPEVRHDFDKLSEDKRAANRAGARRIPEHLALIGFVIGRGDPSDASWKPEVEEAIRANGDLLAQAEHLGWCVERRSRGWTYAPVRNDAKKHHPALVDWAKLDAQNQDKDREAVTAIPKLLHDAGYKATRPTA